MPDRPSPDRPSPDRPSPDRPSPDRPSPEQRAVAWQLSPHARRLLTLALAGLALAAATGRPEFAGLAAPAILLLATLRAGRPARLPLRVRLDGSQAVEGTEHAVTATIADSGYATAELAIEPSDGITVGPPVIVTASEHHDPSASPGLRAVRLPFRPERWGRRQVGLLVVTLRDRYRLLDGEVLAELPWIDGRPQPAPLRSAIVLARLPSRLGEHSARATGEGAEFAGIREFVPGDRQRRINWPATTRHGSVHLTTFAAERAQNIVVIADVTADVGPPGASSLDLVLRGTAGAITRYLAARDRVGLVVFGGRMSWIGPGQGQRHFTRLSDLLIAGSGGLDRAAELTRLPRAALPPGALILVFSPLLDTRLIESVRDLRERGFSVVVIDVLNAEPGRDRSTISGLTARLWRLEQQAIRYSLTQIGVPVAHWDGVSSLDEPLAPYTRRAMVVRR